MFKPKPAIKGIPLMKAGWIDFIFLFFIMMPSLQAHLQL